MCVIKLCSRAEAGFCVLDAAMPAPIPGCITRKGAKTVAIPTSSAGVIVGL